MLEKIDAKFIIVMVIATFISMQNMHAQTVTEQPYNALLHKGRLIIPGKYDPNKKTFKNCNGDEVAFTPPGDYPTRCSTCCGTKPSVGLPNTTEKAKAIKATNK